MHPNTTLRHLSDAELLEHLEAIQRDSQLALVKLLTCLVEIHRRRLHLRGAYSTMLDFCRRKLHLTKDEAIRRARAARIASRYPVVLDMLAHGQLQLTTLTMLGRHLSDENHQELLAEASGKTVSEVAEFIASRFPREDLPTHIRKLKAANQNRKERLSPDRYRLSVTLDATTMEKLERATRLMSHRNPSHDYAVVLDEALDLLLASLERRVLSKTKRPRASKPAPTGQSRMTRAARRAAFERDGEQCSFVSADGVRCAETSFLQIDHIRPRAKGGRGSPANARVLCRPHNLLLAEEAFGQVHVLRRIELARRRRGMDGVPGPDIQKARPPTKLPSRNIAPDTRSGSRRNGHE